MNTDRFEQMISIYHVCPRKGGAKYFLPRLVFLIAFIFELKDTINAFMKGVRVGDIEPMGVSYRDMHQYIIAERLVKETRLYQGQSITHILIFQIHDRQEKKSIIGHAMCSSSDLDKFNVHLAITLARKRAMHKFKETIGNPKELGLIKTHIRTDSREPG